MARRLAGKHRFFVADLRGERVALAGAEGHHAANVLRLDVGAAVALLATIAAVCGSGSPD